jgi:hypothetical protein
MHRKMRRFGAWAHIQGPLKVCRAKHSADPARALQTDALAAFGTACTDDGSAAAALHANQKAMGAGATGFRRLVRAFHDVSKKLSPERSGKPMIISNFYTLAGFIHTLFRLALLKDLQISASCG